MNAKQNTPPRPLGLQAAEQGAESKELLALAVELALLLYWVGAFIWVPVAMALGRMGTNLVKQDPRWKQSQAGPSAVEGAGPRALLNEP